MSVSLEMYIKAFVLAWTEREHDREICLSEGWQMADSRFTEPILGSAGVGKVKEGVLSRES